MTPEIEEMVAELKKEGASFYQAKVVVDSIVELSADEKSEILRQFLPPDKPASVPVIPPIATASGSWANKAEKFLNDPATWRLFFALAKWGLFAFLAYYALWAISRILDRWVMKI